MRLGAPDGSLRSSRQLKYVNKDRIAFELFTLRMVHDIEKRQGVIGNKQTSGALTGLEKRRLRVPLDKQDWESEEISTYSILRRALLR